MKSVPTASEKTSPSSPLGDTWLEVQPGLPMQCWVGACGVALTEMVVYFATGNFPPSGQDLSQSTLQRRGRRGRRRIMRGRLFRSGRTPAFHEALFRKRDSGPTRPTPWELWLLCRERERARFPTHDHLHAASHSPTAAPPITVFNRRQCKNIETHHSAVKMYYFMG